MKGLKINHVLQVIKPEYVYLKLTPNYSIRNQQTHLIARTIPTLFKSIRQSLKREEEKIMKFFKKEFIIGTKWRFEQQGKVGYYLYMEKKKVEFYFVVPRQSVSIMKEKLGDVWSQVTIQEVENIPTFSNQANMYQMVYEKEDGLSLDVDRRDNHLLQSQLNVVDILEENDRLGVFYNFNQASANHFRHQYESTMNKIKQNLPVKRNKMSASYILHYTMNEIDNLLKDLIESFFGKNHKQSEETVLEHLVDRLNGGNQISEHTHKKGNAVILDSQIVIMSESPNTLRQRNNAQSMVQSFESITDDNRLIGKKIKPTINLMAKRLSGVESNHMSDGEAHNFISLAGRDLLEQHNFIEKVETKQTQVPEDLREGVMYLGDNVYRGHNQPAYLSYDPEYQNLSLVIIGPNRAGKSNLMGNLSIDAIENDECVVVFDYISNCELSNEIARLFPKDKVLNIECDNHHVAEGLGYNEIRDSVDPFVQYKNAKLQVSQLMTLINSINSENTTLTAKMERYLHSASLVGFIQGASFKDVFSILYDYHKRKAYISNIPSSQKERLHEYVLSLHELDDIKDGVVIGTRMKNVEGIIDRINKLKQNPYLELMLNKSTHHNIDLVKEFEKNQLITIRMPETMFTTDNERDVYATYWMTKIWLALQVRAGEIPNRNQRKKVNLFIDELYQVKNTERFLTNILSRLPKFRMKPIISCHYLNQIKTLREELRSASASYMLIAGCDKDNYKEFKDELAPYELEDLLNLKRYHSLNLIKSNDGYGRFITKLPGEVEKRKAKIV